MINKLKIAKTTKSKKIVGRGIGSGKGGHTTGRGTKGQKSRSGYKPPKLGFEGGQMPLSRRLPKLKGPTSNSGRRRGFITSKIVNSPVKLSRIAAASKDGDVINFDKLIELKLIRVRNHKDLEVKIVLDKAIDKKLTIEGVKTSASAKAAIEKAGGKVN